MSPLRRNIYPDDVTPQQVRQGIILFTDDADDRFRCTIDDLTAVMQQITRIRCVDNLLKENTDFHLHERKFYVLDEQSAKKFDAKRPEEKKCFATLLPGSNAYLLDEADFGLYEDEDIDPGDLESGCFFALNEHMSKEDRGFLLSSLIKRGYAVSLYQYHLYLVRWHRDITEMVGRDIEEILAALSSSRDRNEDGSILSQPEDKDDEALFAYLNPDNCPGIEFDIRQWLWKADDKAIGALRELSYGEYYLSDDLARDMRKHDKNVKAVLEYCEAIDCGFTCAVPVRTVEAWIRRHRPHLSQPCADTQHEE